ncbi:MAG: rod shape-determining protein MreD [Sphingobacteriales bacterium]|nr:MAG: rod shape-determining protein MreD [Sphingobacteriales bacterium]
MRGTIYNSIFRLIAFLLFQVLLLNQIKLHGFVNPYIYPLGILMFPFETARWLLLLIAFFSGLFVDMFTDTPGLHASALVLMAFVREYVVNINRPVGDYEPGHRPTISSLGSQWFLGYAGLLVLIHHTVFFFIEAYTFSMLLTTIAKIGISALVSLMLMFLFQYLFYSKQNS